MGGGAWRWVVGSLVLTEVASNRAELMRAGVSSPH